MNIYNGTKESLLLHLQRGVEIRNVPLDKMDTLVLKSSVNNTSIDHIPSELFSVFPGLFALQIDYLQITGIAKDDLAKAQKLTEFTVSESKRLRKLSADVLHLPDLVIMTLSKNAIETIDDFTFANLNSLQHLVLSGNELNRINRNTFAGLFNLNRLELDGNKINIIEPGAFTDLKNVHILHLNENKLKILHDHCFDGLTSLQTLNIRSNEIERIQNSLYSLITLEVLSLDDNIVSDLDLVKFAKSLPHLLHLGLATTGVKLKNYNFVSKPSPEAQLEILNLRYNNLDGSANLEGLLRIFPNLEELLLEGNDISPENMEIFRVSLKRRKMFPTFVRDSSIFQKILDFFR